MRKRKTISKLLTCLLVLAMVISLVPSTVFALENSDPAEKLESLTEKADIIDYYIEDESINYGGGGAPIKEVENATYDRIFDGKLAKDYGNLFTEDSGWVSTGWDDEKGGRSLYLNIYRGSSREITIDLGSKYNINELITNIGISDLTVKERDKTTSYGIYALSYIDYYLSDDNENYYLAAHVSDVSDRYNIGYALDSGEMGATGLNFNARYVRIVFPTDVWVFIDEIFINGHTTPAADAEDITTFEKYGSSTYVVDAWPTEEMSGGIRQDFLAYEGWGRYGEELKPTKKTVRDFRAVVALLDENGKPFDWLYDSVTFMGHGWAKDEILMLHNSAYPDNEIAGKKEWTEWLLDAFEDPDNDTEEVTNIDALEQAVKEIKGEMTPNTLNGLTAEEIAAHQVAAKIPVYPTIAQQKNWGELEAGDKYVTVTVDGDDITITVETLDSPRTLDFTLEGHDNDVGKTLSDRASAYLWYMEEAISRFEAKKYENIYLDGFYYFEEQVNSANDKIAEQSIKTYNKVIDYLSEDYSSYWIPYYTVNGFKIWKDLGFDYAVMQPNGYGYGQDRMDSAADQAKKYGLGIEMEWMGHTKEGYVDTFDRYLNTGVSKGYRDAPQAWYWGTDGLTEVAYSTDSLHDVYYKIYNYVSGNPVSAKIEFPADVPERGEEIEITEEMLSLGFLGTPNETGKTELENLKKLIGKLIDGNVAATYDSFNKEDSSYLSFLRTWENTPEGGTQPANDGYFIQADLGQICDVSKLSLDFVAGEILEGKRNAGIGAPSGLVVKVSNDGEHWTAMDVEPDVSKLYPYHYEKQLYTFNANVSARYVRFEFAREVTNSETNETYTFVMFDEMEIKAYVNKSIGPISLTGEMVAAGLAGTPNADGETGLKNANSVMSVLVDGIMPESYNGANTAGKSFVGFSRAWEGTKDESAYDAGYLNSGNYITIELDDNYSITGASIDFLVGKILPGTTRRNAGIGEPTDPVLQISSDGKKWTDVGTMKATVTSSGNYEKYLYTLAAAGNAKYVRFSFARVDLDPTIYKGTDTWLMIDEVSVSGVKVTAPVDPDRPDVPVDNDRLTRDAKITQWNLSDTTWHYNNNQSLPLVEEVEKASYDRLIDGVYAKDHPELFTKDASWVGKSWDDPTAGRGLYINAYHGGERDIIVDLGDTYNITEVGLSLGISDPIRKQEHGDESYGIYAPNTLKIALSTDNENFYNLGELTEVEREDIGYSLDSGVMKFTGINYNARYIRLAFDVEVFVFIDELIVGGSRTPSEDAGDLTKLEKFGEEANIVNTWPTYEDSHQIHHDYLAYQGWGTVNNEIVETYRTVKDLRAVAAYIDENGKPLDWLYDSITFMGHGWTKEKHTYLINSSVPNGPYADRKDWEAQLDHTFNYKEKGEITGVDALEQAMTELKSELKPSGLNGLTQSDINNHKIAIKIPVYPAIPVQDKWGSLKAGEKYVTVKTDEDGKLSYTVSVLEEDKPLDFTLTGHDDNVDATLSDRASVFLWYLEKVVEEFNSKNYKNIYLDGFYYFEEKASVAQDKIIYDTIRVYNMMVDEVGEDYSSYWIPFYTAEGYRDWASYGFDYAVMQPNGYGYDQKRMDTAASLAKKYGLGIEMEWMGNKEGYVDTFKRYLQTGISSGYQNAPQAWYWGTWDFTNFAYNEASGEGLRYIYDYTYKYIKGFKDIEAPLDTIMIKPEMITVGMLGTPNDNGKTNLELIDAAKAVLVDGQYGGTYPWAMNNASTSAYLGFNYGWEGAYDESAYNKGWGNSGYFVQVDLGKRYDLTSAFMDFLYNFASGIGEPNGLVLKTSNDGSSWTVAAQMTESVDTPCAANNAHVKSLYSVELSGISARYVRFEFKLSEKDENNTYSQVNFDEIGLAGTVTASEPYIPYIPSAPSTGAAVELPGSTENGEVSVDKPNAAPGEKVTVTAKPNEGYIVGSVTVTGGSGNVDVVDNENCTFTFTMPSGKVKVAVTFITPGERFKDLDDNAWYRNSVAFAINNGLMNGTSPSTFSPRSETTRGMLVTILYRLEGKPEAGELKFTDVSPTAWYADAVAWAGSTGIVDGISDGIFSPRGTLTREQMATILYRYAKYKGYDLTASADLSAFSDSVQISGWASDAMTWANAKGLITGKSADILDPKGDTTRVQAAAILTRFLAAIGK